MRRRVIHTPPPSQRYTRVCRKIEAAGAGRAELYLARLVLLLMGEVNDRARIERAIDAALEDGWQVAGTEER